MTYLLGDTTPTGTDSATRKGSKNNVFHALSRSLTAPPLFSTKDKKQNAVDTEEMNMKRYASTYVGSATTEHTNISNKVLDKKDYPSVVAETWQAKQLRLQTSSPFGQLPGWSLRAAIFKGGDDCRQEALAMQLVQLFHRAWQDAHLPLKLTPYNVLVTSAHSGLIEVIQNATSLDNLKKSLPENCSLLTYYEQIYGEKTPEFHQARKNFIESLAGYSLLTFILQVKDRHNGNIMIDSEGYIIHIDFGFMLTNSPGGNMNFEAAPFKLTAEYLELMGPQIVYFKMLLQSGFCEIRKHSAEIMLLIDLMRQGGSKMACFVLPNALEMLLQRFKLELDDRECVAFVNSLVEESADNWRTNQYDSFQKLTNGICI